jgi:DNA-binding CsgD family transcriptional regulator
LHFEISPESEVQTVTVLDLETKTTVEELFRQFLECLGEPTLPCAPGATGHEPQEVVFDADLEGIHYTLLRIRPPPDHPSVNLSPREKEVIRLVCAGLPNKAISDVLEISPWTVSSYLKRIFAKLGVGSRAEMVARVLNERLLESNHPQSGEANGPGGDQAG